MRKRLSSLPDYALFCTKKVKKRAETEQEPGNKPPSETSQIKTGNPLNRSKTSQKDVRKGAESDGKVQKVKKRTEGGRTTLRINLPISPKGWRTTLRRIPY